MDDELNTVRIFFRLKKNDNISIENVFKKYDEIMNSSLADAEKQKFKDCFIKLCKHFDNIANEYNSSKEYNEIGKNYVEDAITSFNRTR